uniref:RBPJ-interacting and tubulin-associated protein n=1 Tax=Heterorhabditis bacteriophora TaxID=37862 RepID=A0A1I7WHH5_HETBA
MPTMLGTMKCFVNCAIQLSSCRFLAQTSVRYGTWNMYNATNSWSDRGSNPPLLCTGVTWLANFYLGRRRASERPYGLAPVHTLKGSEGSHIVGSLWDPTIRTHHQRTGASPYGLSEARRRPSTVHKALHSSQHGWHRHLSDDELLKQFSTAVPNASEASKILPLSSPKGGGGGALRQSPELRRALRQKPRAQESAEAKAQSSGER